jgi:hypothetical protein
MGKIFSLGAGIKQVIQDAMDDLLANEQVGGLGKTCLLVYPARYVPCPNCIIDPHSGRSTGRYRHGGPMPFQAGKCPMCQGEARQAQEVSEEITLLCNWEPKKFLTPIKNLEVRAPYSVLETKGFLTDVPKILKTDHMVFQTPTSAYMRQKYKLASEPGDRSNIIQGRYFICQWERWNG